MKENLKFFTIIGIFLISFILVLSNPPTIMESVTFSVSIWKDNLLPTLFPFLILSYLFANYGISYFFSYLTKPVVENILHLPGYVGFILVASLFSGFPSNAKFIKDALDSGEITKEDANRLLKFCFFPNPLFVLGTIGGLFLGSVHLGLLILISHYIASFIIALLTRDKRRKSPSSHKSTFSEIKNKINSSDSFSNVLKKAIFSSLDTMFLLLGVITFFLIITNLLNEYIVLPEILKTIFSGLLEMTQGVKNTSLLKIPLFGRMALMSGILAFGGICIHTQIYSILDSDAPNYFQFLVFRFIHVILALIIMFSLCVTFNIV